MPPILHINKFAQRRTRSSPKAEELRADQLPLLDELAALGWRVHTVWDLVNTAKPYPEVIPTLLAHLQKPYLDRNLEGVARALAAPDAAYAWPILLAEYQKAQEDVQGGIRLGAKAGLAVALSATSTDNVIDQLVALAKDRSHGSIGSLVSLSFEVRMD